MDPGLFTNILLLTGAVGGGFLLDHLGAGSDDSGTDDEHNAADAHAESMRAGAGHDDVQGYKDSVAYFLGGGDDALSGSIGPANLNLEPDDVHADAFPSDPHISHGETDNQFASGQDEGHPLADSETHLAAANSDGTSDETFLIESHDNSSADPCMITDYIRGVDQLELYYTPALDASGAALTPELTVETDSDTSMSTLKLDGVAVAHLAGTPDLTPDDVKLMPDTSA